MVHLFRDDDVLVTVVELVFYGLLDGFAASDCASFDELDGLVEKGLVAHQLLYRGLYMTFR